MIMHAMGQGGMEKQQQSGCSLLQMNALRCEIDFRHTAPEQIASRLKKVMEIQACILQIQEMMR